MKKAVNDGTIGFILIYSFCILFGSTSQDLVGTMAQYLFLSLPAAIAIGLASYWCAYPKHFEAKEEA